MDGNVEKMNMSSTSNTQLTGEKGGCAQGKSTNTFQQIQDAKTDSDNSAAYSSKAAKIMFSTCWVTSMLPSLAGVPLALLINGAIFLDRCPVEPYIPIYMIVSGSFSIVKILIDYALRIKKYNCEKRGPLDKDTAVEKVFGGISSLIGLFLFAFFIAGNVWVFRVYTPNFTDTTAATYCHPTPYWFTFGVIIATYALVGLGIFLFCCCCCCAAAYAAKEATNKSQDKS